MEWLNNLFFGTGIAHCVVAFSIVIALGVLLGKYVKIAGISFGITWILFAGIAASHFGIRVEHNVLHFLKEFGLILFVYSIGLQVGPGFFSSFKKGGLQMNSIAMVVVLSGVALTIALHYATGIPMSTMVGILSGAVTNTPGLGAAEQTFTDLKGAGDPTIALGYAVAYPLGVVGIIISIIAMRFIFRISFDTERKAVEDRTSTNVGAHRCTIEITNPSLHGKCISDVSKLIDRHFVISRIMREDGKIEIPLFESILKKGDKVLVVSERKDADFLCAFIGNRIDMEWNTITSELEARRLVVTNSKVHGKSLGDLGLCGRLSFNITRVNRAGIDLVGHPSLELQIGDRVTAVGTREALEYLEVLLGNSVANLRHPNLAPIFIGIFLGVLVGSIPFMIPGIPQPIKLGLAGGPLIVAILLSRFGTKLKLVTYTTASANLMIREIGIALFLAGVGLGAGEGFVETIVNSGGYKWIGYGVLITVIPLLVAGVYGRLILKTDYFTLMGVISGSMTDPPAIAYSNGVAGNDLPSVGYATVYPLTMFMRVLTAQVLIIFFVV